DHLQHTWPTALDDLGSRCTAGLWEEGRSRADCQPPRSACGRCAGIRTDSGRQGDQTLNYVCLIMNNHPSKLRISSIQRVAQDVRLFTLVEPEGRALPDFTAGSHLELLLPNGLGRSYSLFSAP